MAGFGSSGSNRARRWPTLAVVPVLLVLLAPSAQASDNSTPVAQHASAQVSMTVLGGSAEGYAALVLKPATSTYGLFTAADGEALTERTPGVPLDQLWDVTFFGVVGQNLGYAKDVPGNPTRYELHRMNVISGVDTALGTVTGMPVAFTADSWLSYSGGYVVATRFGDGTVTRLAATGNNPYQVDLTTDGMLIKTMGDGESHLDLVDFGTGTRERVATEPDILNFDISPTTITWWRNQTVGEPQTIKVRERSGGPVVTHTETDDYADTAFKVAGFHEAGYVFSREGAWRLRTIDTSGSVNDVSLPDDSGYLQTDEQRWLLGVTGDSADAGVYAVQGSATSRVATVDTPAAPVWGISFAAGRIYYADNPVFDENDTYPLQNPEPMRVWSRPVTGLGRPVLGDETELKYRTAFLPGDPARSMSFSAGRGVVSGDFAHGSYNWRLLDRGRITGTVKQDWSFQPTGESDNRSPNASGPYLVAAGHVFDPTGRLIYSRPGAAAGEIGQWTGTDDLYGPRLVYTRRAKKSGYSDIWLRDLDRPKSKSNPGKLATVKNSSPLVTIWGDSVAWQSGGREISLLRSGQVRKIKITGPLIELTLGEGTLAWNANARTYTLNTTSPANQPVAYPGAGRTIRLDDHYLARRVGTGAVVVYRSYTAKYRPRLIGTFAPAGFTPNGDGKADSWTPQFDLSKPVKDVELVIRSAKTGSTLRTLTGTGPDGSIRDLVFDGRNGSGKALAKGTYRWELSAVAQDGEGAAIGIRGEKKISGTVTISKVP